MMLNRKDRKFLQTIATLLLWSCAISASGCATTPQVISSEPQGAVVYRLQSGRILWRVGKTPIREERSLKDGVVNFFIPAMRWGEGPQWSDLWLAPLTFPLITLPALVIRLLDVLLPPWTFPTYAAIYQGEFLPSPTSKSGNAIHFDFTRAKAQKIPVKVLEDLKRELIGNSPDAIRERLGNPISVEREPDGEREVWYYSSLKLEFKKAALARELRLQAVVEIP